MLYPVVSHVAEKLHAYTLPRERTNTRVKDLPDLALLASVQGLEALELRTAIDRTFGFRGTHAIPEQLAAPPASWSTPYEAMAKTDRLIWRKLPDVHRAAAAFLDPALGGHLVGAWDHERWAWR